MIELGIQEFGKRLGFDRIESSAAGVSRLDIENIGSLYLERDEAQNELLVYLARPVPQYDTACLRRVFELCDYRRAWPVPVSAGVHAGQVIALTRLSEREVTAARLENVLRFLADFLQQAVTD